MLLALSCGGPVGLGAQRAVVSGTVSIGGGGTRPRPLAGGWAVLHQVTMTSAGPVDSARTDAGGRYRLRVPQLDTAAQYLVSAMYMGVAYFSEPLRIRAAGTTRAGPIVVYDTVSSTTGPPIHLRRRLVTVARLKRDGTRDVLEILELANPGSHTRIAADTVRPVWAGALPAGVLQFRVGEGDFSADAVERRGDVVGVFGPVPPGILRQLTYSYVLPAGRTTLALPVDQPTDEVDLLLEDTTARVVSLALEPLGVEAIEQRRFARYRTGPLAAGGEVMVELPRAGFQLQRQWWIIVVLAGLVFGWALVVALRRKPSAISDQPSANTVTEG
ncbi:MAG: hypothetical protein AUH46_02820 [Gemmatimonadetes bacterium 13_1_40CM_70_15]|nr:MAG: hypothetical protein AUH46_02820 [Gemmatimonadetes bacterium 13_1_40CM_70_15]